MFNLVQLSTGCSKGLLMILNVFCMLLAICIFAFAVVDTGILQQYGDEQANGSQAGDIIIIVATLLLMMIATFGCVGAARENVKIIYLYVGFLMMLVVLELLIAIFVSLQRYGLEFRITEKLREDFFMNATVGDLNDGVNWDELQSNYKCCGLNGPNDYLDTKRKISMSCCQRAYNTKIVHAQDLLYQTCIDTESYYRRGCENEMLDALRAGNDLWFGIAVISCCFEAAGMLLGTFLANNLNNSVKVYKHTVKY